MQDVRARLLWSLQGSTGAAGCTQLHWAVSQPLPSTTSNAATTTAPTTMPAIAPPLKPMFNKHTSSCKRRQIKQGG